MWLLFLKWEDLINLRHKKNPHMQICINYLYSNIVKDRLCRDLKTMH